MNKRTNTSIQMIADYDGDVTNLFNVNIEGELPILPHAIWQCFRE